MRIVFMGTAEFGIPSFRRLLNEGYQVVGVVTNVDKPSGRGQKVTYSPIKIVAEEYKIPILQPVSLKDESFIASLKDLKPDLIIVIAFRILPAAVFTIPALGTFNLHSSLLPKYRGAAPIQWAIIKGEKETGVTTFFLDEKVDTGNIILQARLPIHENETAGELHDRLAEIGAEIVLHSVRLIDKGTAPRHIQDSTLATPAPKIFKEYCRIDWTRPAPELHNFIRGLSPVPCAYTSFQGKTIKLYHTALITEENPGTAGEILKADNRLFVSTPDGVLEILELQLEGKKRLRTEEFLRGFHVQRGEKFE